MLVFYCAKREHFTRIFQLFSRHCILTLFDIFFLEAHDGKKTDLLSFFFLIDYSNTIQTQRIKANITSFSSDKGIHLKILYFMKHRKNSAHKW